MATTFVEEVARELKPGEHAYAVAKKIAEWILDPERRGGRTGWIAGLYGGRGSGKTSILYTILQILSDQQISAHGSEPACLIPCVEYRPIRSPSADARKSPGRSIEEALFSPGSTRDGDDLLFSLLEFIESRYNKKKHVEADHFSKARTAEVRRKDLARFLQYAQETATSNSSIPAKLVEEHVKAAKTTDELLSCFKGIISALTRPESPSGQETPTGDEKKSTLLLVVDDVDLQPQRTLELLELVNLFLRHSGVVVLVAADRDLMLRSVAYALEKRNLGQPGLAGALISKYVPYGWSVPGPADDKRFATLWEGKELGGAPVLPSYWAGNSLTHDLEGTARALLSPLLPGTYRGLKTAHNRMASLRDELEMNDAWRDAISIAIGIPRERIGAALSLCVAVDAQRPELGALAAMLEHPWLFRQALDLVAPSDSRESAQEAWFGGDERLPEALRAIGAQLGRIPDFLQSQAQRPSGVLDVQAHELPLLDRLGPPFVDGRGAAEARRLVAALFSAIRELTKESTKASAIERFLAISLNADAYATAEPLRAQREFVAHQEIHIDLRRFAPSGRASPEELREAREAAKAQIEVGRIRSLRGRIDLHAKAQLPLLLWLGWYLRYPGRIIAHNARRRDEGTTLVPFAGPDDTLRFQDRGKFETLFAEPQDLATEGDEAIVLIDLAGRSTVHDLARFHLESPGEGPVLGHRAVLRVQRMIEPEDLLPILHDVIELLGQVRERGVRTFHLGFAGPDVVAFFLGQQLNAWGRVRLYEFYNDHYEHVFDLEG